MHSTFVPSEVSRQSRPMQGWPAHPKSRRRETAPADSRARYRLFRRQHEPELYCAVPPGQPLPAFLRSDLWQAIGEMHEAGPMPLGFDPEAARIGIQLNGFYLFIAFDPIPEWNPDGEHPSWQMPRGGDTSSARMAN